MPMNLRLLSQIRELKKLFKARRVENLHYPNVPKKCCILYYDQLLLLMLQTVIYIYFLTKFAW
jgi:hypothetical protein